jgi:DNA-binding IclR family transcriptional regulator
MTGPTGVEEVATAADCDRSTAYRLLTAFGDAGLPLERVARGSYRMDRGAFLTWLEGPQRKRKG